MAEIYLLVHTVPYAVKHVAVWEYPDVYVGYQYVVEAALLLVAEERVRHPDLGRVRHREVLDLACGGGGEINY